MLVTHSSQKVKLCKETYVTDQKNIVLCIKLFNLLMVASFIND